MIIKNVYELELDPLAELNPLMDEQMYRLLLEDIDLNGMTEPITIVDDNKIIDGRHRWLVHRDLGVDTIACVDKTSMSQQEREAYVYSTERRRHQSSAQLAISAWNYYMKNKKAGNKISMVKAADKFGSSPAQVKRVNKIAGTNDHQMKRPDIIDNLFKSIKFTLPSGVETDSLYTIEEFLVKQKKLLHIEPTAKPKSAYDLTEEEDNIVIAFMLAFKKESLTVREAIARRAYAYNKNDIDSKTTSDLSLAETLQEIQDDLDSTVEQSTDT